MIHHVCVYKHYSVASFYDLDRAHARLEQISERYPDRYYVITTNGRSGYTKYKVEQVRQFDVKIDLPPEPKKEHYARALDFHTAHQLWTHEKRRYLEDAEADLRKRMNP